MLCICMLYGGLSHNSATRSQHVLVLDNSQTVTGITSSSAGNIPPTVSAIISFSTTTEYSKIYSLDSSDTV